MIWSTFFQLFSILWHLGSCWSPRRHQGAFKTPSRTSKTPPGASKTLQDASKKLLWEAKKTKIFLGLFKVFDVQGQPGAILARHGLQDDFKSPWNVFHGFQDAFRNLSDGSKGLQDTPKSSRCSQDTSPRSPKIENFIMLFNLLAFLGLLGGSSLNMVVKTLPRCLQEPPKCA